MSSNDFSALKGLVFVANEEAKPVQTQHQALYQANQNKQVKMPAINKPNPIRLLDTKNGNTMKVKRCARCQTTPQKLISFKMDECLGRWVCACLNGEPQFPLFEVEIEIA